MFDGLLTRAFAVVFHPNILDEPEIILIIEYSANWILANGDAESGWGSIKWSQ